MFKPLKQPKKRLADMIYDQIMDAINNGEITPATRLVQEKLAEQFGISRTPVRESLFRLAQEGILYTSDHGTFQLYKITKKDTLQLYQLRAAIESQAARIVTKNASEKMFMALRKIIKDKENIADTASIRDYFEANLMIHRAIVLASKNKYLLKAFDTLWNRGSSYKLFTSIGDMNMAQSLGGHMLLIDEMENRDVVRTGEAMIAHIYEGLELQLAAIKK